MSIHDRRLQIVLSILQQYDHQKPFPSYLSSYFRSHPNMGSRDRKIIRAWCYYFFRTGSALNEQPEKKIAAGAFLSAEEQNDELNFLTGQFLPGLIFSPNESVGQKLDKLQSVVPDFDLNAVFPLPNLLSPEIDKRKWIESFFIQPEIYIRVKKGRSREVLSELEKKGISMNVTSVDNCFSVAGLNQVEKLETYRRGYFELQDKMSQQTATFMQAGAGERWWDACAASGGKSLLLLENQPDVFIEATDLRASVLENYSERMIRNGWKKKFSTRQMDLLKENFPDDVFDGIIADVPCSGSGTWSRNPEWIGRYMTSDIEAFSLLQRNIVNNLIPSLKPGKKFIYITCSAFFIENEGNIQYIEKNFSLSTERMQYLSGYREKADTLFVCLMKKL